MSNETVWCGVGGVGWKRSRIKGSRVGLSGQRGNEDEVHDACGGGGGGIVGRVIWIVCPIVSVWIQVRVEEREESV